MRLSGFHKAYQQALYFKWRTNGAAGERASERASDKAAPNSRVSFRVPLARDFSRYRLSLNAYRFIHNFGTLEPGEFNQDFSFGWLARTLACIYARIFKFSAITNSHIFPDEGSIAETSEFYLKLSAFNLPPSHFFLTISI